MRCRDFLRARRGNGCIRVHGHRRCLALSNTFVRSLTKTPTWSSSATSCTVVSYSSWFIIRRSDCAAKRKTSTCDVFPEQNADNLQRVPLCDCLRNIGNSEVETFETSNSMATGCVCVTSASDQWPRVLVSD